MTELAQGTLKTKAPHRVLVTGSAGAIGRNVCRTLSARGHIVRGFDIQPTPDVQDHAVGSITDAHALTPAMGGIDSIVHLAATPSEADFVGKLVPNNVIGVYHVLEAARQAKVRRVILASSIQTIQGLLPPDRVIGVGESAPANHYGMFKLWSEQVGRMYAHKFELSILAARIGWYPRDVKAMMTISKDQVGMRLYLSHDDAGRFFTAAIEAQGISFAVLYAVSHNNNRAPVDLEPGRLLIGFNPTDSYPQGSRFDAA